MPYRGEEVVAATISMLGVHPSILDVGSRRNGDEKGMVAYALWEFTELSFPEIARLLGYRCHSAVHALVLKYEQSRTRWERKTWLEFVRWAIHRARAEAGQKEWVEGSFISQRATPMSAGSGCGGGGGKERTMPAKSEKQRKAAGAELGRRRKGKKGGKKKPFGTASTEEVKKFAAAGGGKKKKR